MHASFPFIISGRTTSFFPLVVRQENPITGFAKPFRIYLFRGEIFTGGIDDPNGEVNITVHRLKILTLDQIRYCYRLKKIEEEEEESD